ncbi:MAG: hypothetical protein NXY57DRAFT_770772 [Lentinula lateritia]|nr:MAG: hypothetical protein NXY57DRAFT_770772 [Lentinula lateritia]
MVSTTSTANPNSSRLSRLISLLLEIHPNALSVAYATSNETPSFSDHKYPFDFEGIAELDQEFCLGLGFGEKENTAVHAPRSGIFSENALGGQSDKHVEKFEDFEWEDVLQAYVGFSTTSLATPTTPTPITSTSTHSSTSSYPLLPPAIHQLIAHVHAQSLLRKPIKLPFYDQNKRMVGMSPKKAHEVTRMAAYVAFIAQKLRVPNGVYIVDVGAGQGHLARELLDVVPSVRGVLALDGDAVLVEKQTNARPNRGWANLKGKDYDVDGIDRGDATQVTHKFCRVSSSEKLIEAVDEWFVEMETSEVLRSDVPKPVILISLHGCGSLSLDVLRACVGNSDGTEEFVQRSKRKWGFIASVTVPCCYNLLRDGEYPLCAPSSSLSSHPESCGEALKYRSFNQLASPFQAATSPITKYILPHPLTPNAYHLAAQVPDTWVFFEPIKTSLPCSMEDLTSKKIGIETVNTTVHPAIADCTPSVSASLAVRKVVWRALLECVLVRKGIKLDNLEDNSSKLGFIPPMEANAYIQGGTNIKDLDPSLSSTSTSYSGKTGSNLEQGRLGKIGRFPSRAYDSWATFLGMAEARLGVDLSHEKSWTTRSSSPSSPPSMSAVPSAVQPMPSSQSITIQKSTSGTARRYPISATLAPSLAPLARALSIFHVLRCILGPLVESALLEDRVQWVRGQLVAHRPGFPTAEGQEQEVKLVKTNVEMGYEASLVPLFSQLGEAGSARNIAVVVVPKYLSG